MRGTGEAARAEARVGPCRALHIRGRTQLLCGRWDHGGPEQRRLVWFSLPKQPYGCVWEMDCQGLGGRGSIREEVTSVVQAKDDGDWAQGVAVEEGVGEKSMVFHAGSVLKSR